MLGSQAGDQRALYYLARAFRAEMLASDQTLTGSVRAIVRSIEARLGRKRTLRREHVIDVLRNALEVS